MGAFNIPPTMMNLTLLIGIGGVGLALLIAVIWSLVPLPVAIVLSVPLGWTLLTAITVGIAASAPLQQRTTWLFGKRADGKVPWHRWLPFWPFHAAAALVMRGYRWVSSEPLATKIESGLYLSGCPASSSHLPPGPPPAVLDVTCEMPRRVRSASISAYKMLPSWETHGLPPELLEEGVRWALQQREAGHPVLVYCTHGHSRSAIVVCAILVAAGSAGTLEEARSKVQAARPGVHPNRRQWAALEAWHRRYYGGEEDSGA